MPECICTPSFEDQWWKLKAISIVTMRIEGEFGGNDLGEVMCKVEGNLE